MAYSCETFANYAYDEEEDCYECAENMDEDDYGRLLSGNMKECPYYQNNDEYRIVRKQM